MKPMKPMKPMEPMKPMSGGEKWWPSDLGHPPTTGSQNGLRYAFFADRHRLLIEQDEKLTTYDSGDHLISGVSQSSEARSAAGLHEPERFDKLDDLNQVD